MFLADAIEQGHFVQPGPNDNEGFRKTFPCPLRDVEVCHEQETRIFALLESGVLVILNSKLLTIRQLKVLPDGLRNTPPLPMHQTFESESLKFLSLPFNDKTIGLCKVRDLLEGNQSMSKYSDPHMNSILDYRLLQDWRRSCEDFEQTIVMDSVAIASIALE